MPNASCNVNVGEPFTIDIQFCNIITTAVKLGVARWEELKLPDGKN